MKKTHLHTVQNKHSKTFLSKFVIVMPSVTTCIANRNNQSEVYLSVIWQIRESYSTGHISSSAGGMAHLAK